MWQNPTNREELDSGKILWNFDLKKDSLLVEKKDCPTATYYGKLCARIHNYSLRQTQEM